MADTIYGPYHIQFIQAHFIYSVEYTVVDPGHLVGRKGGGAAAKYLFPKNPAGLFLAQPKVNNTIRLTFLFFSQYKLNKSSDSESKIACFRPII